MGAGRGQPVGEMELRILKAELIGMFGHIQHIRRELAAIGQPGATDHFSKMADQLDAIVEATEGATNAIMENIEQIEGLVESAKARVEDVETRAILDRVAERAGHVFEACSFQDITGQRVTKVVKSLQYVEGRVNALVRMWGREEIEKVVVDLQETDPDQALLNGPQRPGQGVKQSDIDKLFSNPGATVSQGDIDKLFG